MTFFNTLLSHRNQAQSAGTVAPAPTVTPRYEIKENPDAFGLEVWLPGVTKDGLELTIDDGELTIIGRRSWKKPEGWSQLYRETPLADFSLTLSHDNTFDAEKVNAELRDGVLRVTLPKSESIKPRKIAIS
ncbi:MAG TPA: Hsp20/alpha crystallin family protein [Opitutaceae bacterium]|nr:Hsp20/alpha crystallin family protein [Opitutaceae bacterium]